MRGRPQVNHLNGIKGGNGVSNLEWSTNAENQTHAIEARLKVFHSGKKASRYVGGICVYRDGEFQFTVHGNLEMKEKGLDYRLVSATLLGKRKSHRGFTFKREEN